MGALEVKGHKDGILPTKNLNGGFHTAPNQTCISNGAVGGRGRSYLCSQSSFHPRLAPETEEEVEAEGEESLEVVWSRLLLLLLFWIVSSRIELVSVSFPIRSSYFPEEEVVVLEGSIIRKDSNSPGWHEPHYFKASFPFTPGRFRPVIYASRRLLKTRTSGE